jgi:hypothetical protein
MGVLTDFPNYSTERTYFAGDRFVFEEALYEFAPNPHQEQSIIATPPDHPEAFGYITKWSKGELSAKVGDIVILDGVAHKVVLDSHDQSASKTQEIRKLTDELEVKINSLVSEFIKNTGVCDIDMSCQVVYEHGGISEEPLFVSPGVTINVTI